MPDKRVLFAASEVFPFAKSGGLADVANSLPKALAETFDVTVVMPLYRFIDREAFGIKPRNEAFEVVLGKQRHAVSLYESRFEGNTYLFVYTPPLCERDHLYGPPEQGYSDNALRFGLFCYAIVRVAEMLSSDIVHLNDWQTALAALLIAEDDTLQAKTVYTIHNLSYQGVFEKEALSQLQIAERYFTLEGIEFYGNVSFMKAGIGYADAVTTVSPRYAQEILTPAFGCGLEGYLQVHRAKLTGITNGIDTAYFSPSTDKTLARPYKTPRGKAFNKERFLEESGLSDSAKPLFIFVGRFTWQKGLDLLIGSLPKMAKRACNIAILGEGEARYHKRLERIAKKARNVSLTYGYNEALAHRAYAAADFLLMPSLFEPCGLNQFIAMHYGALPIVHGVGGLADTVQPLDACGGETAYGCGIRFQAPTHKALLAAFDEAMALYEDAPRYRKAAAFNMQVDFSWRQSAEVYADVYRKISEGAVE